jgi:hypothetical protein
MPTYIKTGFWDKKAKAPDGWLDLNQFVQTLIPPPLPPTPSTNIYNSDGTLTGNRILSGANNSLSFIDLQSVVLLNNIGSGLYLSGVGSNTLITRFQGNKNGLDIEFANNIYRFGKIQGGNVTQLIINDAAAYPVQVSGTNVSSGTAGAASGQFLNVKVNGVDYKIALLNP